MTSIALALVLIAQSSSAPSRADANLSMRQAVEALERHWLDVENDPVALEEILADDFLHVLPIGVITKREQLDFMRSHPAPKTGGTKRFDDLRVRVFDTAAVATGIVVATTPDGKTQKTVFTDVFAYRNGKWLAVNAQETPLQQPAR
jgi:hypothetical protein